MACISNPVFTVGHSTRPLDEFLALLSESAIGCVVDVRRLPGSRRFPHYNADALAHALATRNIDYWHLEALCGRRTRRELEGAAPEGFWQNASFARYAAYARSSAFDKGLQELLDRASSQRCTLMCSEAVWWRCHRRIIADHLLARGVQVLHILGRGHISAATLTPGAIVRGTAVIYPPTAGGQPHAPHPERKENP
ncbi:DUF488 domain-containing protein [Stenotrophomonas sp. YIM B06876]|uniref:DUF488 domain-containing protein n=1 Tax=Stenotrophomonas sp. YIM B06876 TaxID=3060211 RepID=UPI002738C306|nr:DUF488 domain-containing protein [Stenotrophomonas sp. YIM B06876]